MLIYIIVILSVLVLSKFVKKDKYNLIDVLIILILVLVSGLRLNIGTDYAMYNAMYFNPDAANVEKVEIGYKILMKIGYNIFHQQSYMFFMLCSLITIVPIYVTIKKFSSKPGESIFYFIALGFYILTFNMVRQAIAMSICIFCMKYIFDKKKMKFLLGVLLASTFHMTALIMIPMYWLARINLNKAKTLMVVVGALIVGFLFEPIYNYLTSIIPQYQMYVRYKEATPGIGTYIINSIYLIIIVFAVFNKNKIKESEKETKEKENKEICINLVLYSTIFIILSMKNILFARLIYYWLLPIILILPNYIECFKKQNRNIIQFVFLIGMLAFYMTHIYSFNGVYPYQSIFGA